MITINERTGTLIDGHLRVTLADRAGMEEIDAIFVDLSEEEEKLILATLDPLSAMAVTDEEQLSTLLKEVTAESPALQDLLDSLVTRDYDPNLLPEIEMPDVTAEDIERTADRLEHGFEDGRKQEEIMCPHCGSKFYLDS